jgi:hypothetical protein
MVTLESNEDEKDNSFDANYSSKQEAIVSKRMKIQMLKTKEDILAALKDASMVLRDLQDEQCNK